MGILDSSLEIAPNQAITATASSTHVLDLAAMPVTAYNKAQLKQHLGRAMCVPLLIQVTENFATLTSLTVQLRQSASSNMASPTVLLSQEVPVAKLKRGFKFNIDKLPAEVTQRYVDLNFVVGGSDATAGKVYATIPASVEDAYDGLVH